MEAIARKAVFAGVYIYTLTSFYLRKLYQNVLLFLYLRGIYLYTPIYNTITYFTDDDEIKISVNLTAYDMHGLNITHQVKFLLYHCGNNVNILSKYLPRSVHILYLHNNKLYSHFVNFNKKIITTSQNQISNIDSVEYDMEFNRLNFEHD